VTVQVARDMKESVAGRYGGVGLIIASEKGESVSVSMMTIYNRVTCSCCGVEQTGETKTPRNEEQIPSSSSSLNGQAQSETPNGKRCSNSFCGATVVDSFETYAFDYGLRIGDRIVAIDGRDMTTATADDVKERLRGALGTSVTGECCIDRRPDDPCYSIHYTLYTIHRASYHCLVSVTRPVSASNPDPLQRVDIVLPRQEVHISDVKLATFLGDPKDGIGYINLHGFNSGSVKNRTQYSSDD